MSLTARKPAPDEAILKQHRSSPRTEDDSSIAPPSGYEDSVSSQHPWPAAPPAWVDDRATTRCMMRGCGTSFDGVLERRHHCRFCGNIFCQTCSSKNGMLPPEWNIKEPQRVCNQCFRLISPYQSTWVKVNANAQRDNYLEDDLTSRYMNSPLRFTLGGEIRKAAYTIHNLTDPTNVNFWARDVDYTTELLEAVEGILFMTVGKVAFIGGVRVGTGLVVARLGDGSWSAPCAVGSFGITFGACVGAEVTDMVTGIDKETMEKFANDDVSNVVLGGEASLALGPFGRTAAGEVHVPAMGPADKVEAYMSYSQSRGAFGGVTVEAAYVKTRDDVNEKFYGYAVKPSHIFDGTIPKPKAAAPLYDALGQFYAQVFPDRIGPGYGPPPPPPSSSTQNNGQLQGAPAPPYGAGGPPTAVARYDTNQTTTTRQQRTPPRQQQQQQQQPKPPPRASPFGQFGDAPPPAARQQGATPSAEKGPAVHVVKAVPATEPASLKPTVVVAVPSPARENDLYDNRKNATKSPYDGEESAEL
mmetsp:Transcript_1174/g.3986  ORF Transcript_1174/g.3986 Transcript_1174/m.3986 type:complete len:528 (-) Transcript_1174:651-2234(-)|eukprot:CAMPEP_0118896734 /NCGR_PEP_ID=MMETSP1166-20130328/4456_1 /TAXON_ID=1104430 /ORGANISM="Chrysoreinhardia sp, Strain CCMP3193" /LENGTH=527 /DNA_ID=CAMNT_0006835793 /DNA_START=140 /DNA_END=1723 /DNA_ORIENTATION=-